ncbi:hypothetical protein [Sulfobacillus harzensis]|uniref:Uncharacterized protein n=1 Tax=Sulfobacillus harzensis TaxID=2729629 RepID=A0A7Y0L7V3_9FIRM|nr:hypothetical protein [Sulfobacillus harzensis]NMP24045.1 hypothetical protein [Sulfobacillus harzensis]
MNLDAVYGASVAAKASRAGALALTATSLQALPAAVSPLDTAQELKKTHQPASVGGLPNGWIFGILLAVLILWIIVEGRRRR